MRRIAVVLVLLLAGCCGDIQCQLSKYMKSQGYEYMNPPNDIDGPGSLFNVAHARKMAAQELKLGDHLVNGTIALTQFTGKSSVGFGLDALGIIATSQPSPGQVGVSMGIENARVVSIKLRNPQVRVLTEFGYRMSFMQNVSKQQVRTLQGIFPDNKVYYISEAVMVEEAECSFSSETSAQLAVSANATAGVVQLTPTVKATYKGGDQVLLSFSKPLYIGYKMDSSVLPRVVEQVVMFAPDPRPDVAGKQTAFNEARAALDVRIAQSAKAQRLENAAIDMGSLGRATVTKGAVTITQPVKDDAPLQQSKKELQLQSSLLGSKEAKAYYLAMAELRETELAYAEWQERRRNTSAKRISFSEDMSKGTVEQGDRIIRVDFGGPIPRPTP